MVKDAIISDTKERMEKAIATLERDFNKLRTGRASISIVENIKADYYGTLTAINQVASIVIADSRTITIQPWDKGAFAAIEKAILKSDIGLTPINDGKLIRICIPTLTEERRKELVKFSRKYTEETKIAIRNIRRDANDQFKKLEKDKSISEDELKDVMENIQKITDTFVADADKRCQAKEKQVMDI